MRSTRMFLAALVLVPMLLSVDARALSGSWYFTWNPVTQDQNGNPTELTGYNIHCGNSPRTYTRTWPVTDPKANQAPVSDVVTDDGQWYCAVTAVNAAGESDYSEEVRFFVNAGTVNLPAAPAVPTGFNIAVR